MSFQLLICNIIIKETITLLGRKARAPEVSTRDAVCCCWIKELVPLRLQSGYVRSSLQESKKKITLMLIKTTMKPEGPPTVSFVSYAPMPIVAAFSTR
jgi:hypothetical protein